MRKKKILLVDDSRTSIFLERMLLRDGPYDLIEANDGVQAVEKAKAEHPDLILMDMMMPRMDGLEALRSIRNGEETRTIPVIMVTTRSESDRVETAYEIGCSDYVTKPIEQGELLKKVRSLLGAAEEAAHD
jgi:CheY-like chemotaxis protein